MLCKRGLCRHAVCVSVCVCPSRSYILSKRINISSKFFLFFHTEQHGDIPTGTQNGGVECRWGRHRSRFWAYIWLHCLLLRLQQARCCQHGRQWTTATVCHKLWHITGTVVSGGVDCGRRRRNVYDKKPQCYAKDNRTAHLSARSDKSVAYITNNKRLYSTFCAVEAKYWQTRSIVRPLYDSRAFLYSKRWENSFLQWTWPQGHHGKNWSDKSWFGGYDKHSKANL